MRRAPARSVALLRPEERALVAEVWAAKQVGKTGSPPSKRERATANWSPRKKPLVPSTGSSTHVRPPLDDQPSSKPVRPRSSAAIASASLIGVGECAATAASTAGDRFEWLEHLSVHSSAMKRSAGKACDKLLRIKTWVHKNPPRSPARRRSR